MNRRALILLPGAGPLLGIIGRAAMAAGTPRVGVLDPGLPELFDAFYSGMRDLGYVETQTVLYERRVSTGRPEELARGATELARAKVDLIVTGGPPAVRAAMDATATIPIVFAALGDAVGSGAVTSLARPDRNTTGLSFLNTEIADKRMQLLRELLPSARRVAVLSYSHGSPGNREAGFAAARALGFETPVFEVTDPDEFDSAFAQAVAAQAEAMNVLASPFFNTHRERLVAVAAKYRLPAMYETGEYIRAGGLISSGPDLADLFRRAARYVDKILKGAKPADLPVEQPTHFLLSINLKTAKALGLVVPQAVLARGDEVIE